MTKKFKEELFLADDEKWDSSELGRDGAYVRVADPKHLKGLKNALNTVSEKEFFRRGREHAKLADLEAKKSPNNY